MIEITFKRTNSNFLNKRRKWFHKTTWFPTVRDSFFTKKIFNKARCSIAVIRISIQRQAGVRFKQCLITMQCIDSHTSSPCLLSTATNNISWLQREFACPRSDKENTLLLVYFGHFSYTECFFFWTADEHMVQQKIKSNHGLFLFNFNGLPVKKKSFMSILFLSGSLPGVIYTDR